MTNPSPQDIKPTNAPPSTMPYVWASMIVVLIGAVFVLGLLFLRPNADPLIIIGAVFGPLLPLAASILSFMKSQETHLSVNSQLDAWKKEYGRMQRAEATIDATKEEQARVAEMRQVRVEDKRSMPPMMPSSVVPVPVEIVSPDPVSVKVINVDDK